MLFKPRPSRGAGGKIAARRVSEPLVFAPGYAMLFDWSTARAVIAGAPTAVKAAQVRFPIINGV